MVEVDDLSGCKISACKVFRPILLPHLFAIAISERSLGSNLFGD